MNLEKYKKFLDGLGTLRGICDPQRGEAELLGATICHRWPIPADPALPARPGGAAAFPGRQPGEVVLPRLRFTSLFCPLLGFGAGHKGEPPSPCEQLWEPGEAAWQITTGKGIELEFLLQGTAGCCSHGMGADPALLRVFSPSARWHPGAGCCFPTSLLSKALPQCSALSCLSGCPWRASWDTRSCWAGPWQVAGGRQPLSHCHRQ